LTYMANFHAFAFENEATTWILGFITPQM
jgi:hypothetical protein